MIAFLRGPGGFFTRFASEAVPAGIAVAVGASLLPLVSPLTAGLGGALAWPLASGVLRGVRRRTALRRLYRLALLAHVAFWSYQGIAASHLVPARTAIEVAGSAAWQGPGELHAGYGARAFTLPARTSLAGWGSRPRRVRLPAFGGAGVIGRASQRWMAAPGADGVPRIPMFRASDEDARGDVLGARALVLRPAAASGGAPAAIVRLDLVTSDGPLHTAIAAGLADLGFLPETVLVAATHTHSGPGGYASSPLSALLGTDHFRADVFAAIRDAAVAAARAAFDAAEPARIALVRARDRAAGAPILARNRRAEDPLQIDDRVYVLRVDAVAGDRPIACVLNYPIHPILHARRHMAFDRDLAGGLEDALEAALGEGMPVLFLNGAQGDITAPAVAAPDVEARIARLASTFAEAVAPAVRAARGTGVTEARLACCMVRRDLGTPRLVADVLGDRPGCLEAVARPCFQGDPEEVLRDVLAAPVNVAIWSVGIPEGRLGFTWGGDVAASVNLTAAWEPAPLTFGAWVLELGRGTPAQRVGLLWEPGEAVQELGRAWRAAAADLGLEDTLVVGLANGSCAYITPPATYARSGYEAEATFFGRETGPSVTAALTAALEVALAHLR